MDFVQLAVPPEQLLRSGRPAEASRALASQIQQMESPALWNDWATAEFLSGNPAHAELGCRRALLLDPTHRVAAVNLSKLLIRQGRLEEAEPILRPHAGSLSRDDKTALTELTVRCGGADRSTRLPQAHTLSQAFLAVVSLMPNDDPALPGYLRKANRRNLFDTSHNVGQCHALFRQLPQAAQLAVLNCIGSLPNPDHRLLLLKARHDTESGNWQAALPILRHALEIRPLDLYAQRLLMECELALAPAEARENHRWSGVDEYLAGRFCDRPWREVQLTGDGSVLMCCEAMLPAAIGNVRENSAEEIWNGAAAQEVRESILDGSFRYCSRMHCPRICCRDLPPREAAAPLVAGNFAALPGVRPIGNAYLRPPSTASERKTAGGGESAGEIQKVCKHGPQEIVLANDPTCNLACPMCRQDFSGSNPKEVESLETMTSRFLGLLPGAQTLRLNAAGEVLASKYGRALLKRLTRRDYPNLRFILMSNGQLCNQRAFEEFDLWGRLSDISISIDAVNEETYRVLRRGGDFQRLLGNLKYLDDLRKNNGEAFTLTFFFVVSARNYKEMPEFVRLARRFHADLVAFYSIRNNAGDTPQEFHQINVESPSHPEHAEFLKVLEAPELQDACVDLANLGYLRPLASVG